MTLSFSSKVYLKIPSYNAGRARVADSVLHYTVITSNIYTTQKQNNEFAVLPFDTPETHVRQKRSLNSVQGILVQVVCLIFFCSAKFH